MSAIQALRGGRGFKPHIYKEGGWWFVAYEGHVLPILGRDNAICCAALFRLLR